MKRKNQIETEKNKNAHLTAGREWAEVMHQICDLGAWTAKRQLLTDGRTKSVNKHKPHRT